MTNTAMDVSQSQSQPQDAQDENIKQYQSNVQKQKEDSALRKVGRKVRNKLVRQGRSFRMGSGRQSSSWS